MVFSEGEAQQLIEILSEKAGIVQDTWHTVGLSAPRWPFTAGPASAEPWEGELHIFLAGWGPVNPEGQFWRPRADFFLLEREGRILSCMLGGSCLWGKRVGLEVVGPTDALPRAHRRRRRGTRSPS